MKAKKHSLFAASSSERWLNCPGSVMATKDMKSEDSVFSIEGTTAHALAAVSLEKKVCPTKIRASFVEKFIKENEENADIEMLDDEMRSYVKVYYDQVMEVFTKNRELMIEQKFDLSWVNPKVLGSKGYTMFGTADAVVVEPYGDIWIFDLKYGKGLTVNALNNTQLAYYTLGIAELLKWEFGKVHIHISQPRRDHFPVWSLGLDELSKWTMAFKKGVDRALTFDAPLISGDHCKYCPAQPTCPALRGAIATQAQLDFDDSASLPVKINSLLPAQLSAILDKISVIEEWIDALRKKAFNDLEKGLEVPGYKLVDKRGRRVWDNPKLLAKTAKAQGRADFFTEPELKSPAQLEKIAGKEFVNKRTTFVSSGKTLAKESDIREKLTSKIESDFAD